MSVIEVIIVAIGITLDAFAVATCRGASQKTIDNKNLLLIGIIFAVVQTLMLAIGMATGLLPCINIDTSAIISINQWFSAIILIILGIKEIKKASKLFKVNERREDKINYKEIITLAFATSIDAFVLGIGLALAGTKIVSNILIIFIFTAIQVIIGMFVGYRIGEKYRSQVEAIGGSILLIMGIKIILECFIIL